MRIVEQTEGHYEIQEVQFGKVYRWRPESVTIECEECKTRSIHTHSSLISSVISCECGKDDTTRIREEVVIQVLEDDKALHPWRDWHTSEGSGIPF